MPVATYITLIHLKFDIHIFKHMIVGCVLRFFFGGILVLTFTREGVEVLFVRGGAAGLCHTLSILDSAIYAQTAL